jgi:alpha-galactosidase
MALFLASLSTTLALAQDAASTRPAPDLSGHILTPAPPPAPRINGAKIYGQRPGRPFLYTVPATGERPMSFSADGLPAGLKIDSATGMISGTAENPGEFTVTLRATNAKGQAEKALKIVIGDTIALTPAMGWNSWNCWGASVDREKVLAAAKAMANSGLINHGWTYINIDDAWQGKRGGEFNGIQPNEKFPDMKRLCDEVHAMGLKIGIYSTPWVTSYAGYCGGSSDNPEGSWDKSLNNRNYRRDGQYPMASNDAKQWAAWGIDYLKYDWNPRSAPAVSNEQFHKQTATMQQALHDSGRDINYSYSNSMPFDQIEDQSKMFNSWRTTGDIRDTWWSVTRIGFQQSKWAPFSGPGHWNDPDMLVVGYVGWGPNLHASQLTPDEQFTHISLWSLLASPLLIGCDMTKLDPFTISLLTNDEVLAINQDALGKQASKVFEEGEELSIPRPGRPSTRPSDFSRVVRKQVWARPLEDGSYAVGLFNLGDEPTTVTANWSDLKVPDSKYVVRDLWRQKDLGSFEGKFESTVAPHGVTLVRLAPVK